MEKNNGHVADPTPRGLLSRMKNIVILTQVANYIKTKITNSLRIDETDGSYNIYRCQPKHMNNKIWQIASGIMAPHSSNPDSLQGHGQVMEFNCN